MENFDIKSAKYITATIAMCLIFVISLHFVYKNASNENQNTQLTNVEQTTSEKIETSTDKPQEEKSETTENKKTVVQEESIADTTEKISENTTNTDDIVKDTFEKAMKLREEQKYESAVYEYQQLLKSIDDAQIQSNINKEIALTYASIKRYGTALAYSQKAYNLAPDTEKELLLARLYYKTGNIEKSTNHINDILKRDFIIEK